MSEFINNHFLFIGWSSKAEEMAEILLAKNKFVLLLDNLEKPPLSYSNFHYIYGCPTEEMSYEKAFLSNAQSVYIFTSDNIKEKIRADGQTLIISTAVMNYLKGKKRKPFITVELVNKSFFRYFKHIDANKYIIYGESTDNAL